MVEIGEVDLTYPIKENTDNNGLTTSKITYFRFLFPYKLCSSYPRLVNGSSKSVEDHSHYTRFTTNFNRPQHFRGNFERKPSFMGNFCLMYGSKK